MVRWQETQDEVNDRARDDLYQFMQDVLVYFQSMPNPKGKRERIARQEAFKICDDIYMEALREKSEKWEKDHYGRG